MIVEQASQAEFLPLSVSEPGQRLLVHVSAPFPSVRLGLLAMLQSFEDLDVQVRSEISPDSIRRVPDVQVSYLASGASQPDHPDPDELHTPQVLIVEGPLADLPQLSERPLAVLPAEVDAPTLHTAIFAVVQGLTLIDSMYAASTGISWRQPIQPATTDADRLTTRESQVLELVAIGMPNKSIAHSLGISEHTVKFHVGSILAKLGAESRTEAVTLATRRGLLAV